MALPVEEVASNMGLEVRRVSLTRNLTLFGMTIFADTSIRYYDRENALSSFFGVGKGTILVDPDVCFMRNIDSFWKMLGKIMMRANNKSVRLCGQLPIVPHTIERLLNLGYKEFTVHPMYVQYVKNEISICNACK
jgi:hypothetical protein